MPSYAEVILLGHLGGDPEMRFTPTGTPVTSFTVATDRRYTKSDGEKVQETQWWRIIAWNKLAEICNEFLVKGSLVLVSGEPKLSRWTRQDGSSGATLEVRARQVKFLSRKTEGSPDVVEHSDSPEMDDILR